MSEMYIDKVRCALLLEHLKRYARNKHGQPVCNDGTLERRGYCGRYIGVHAI